MYFSDVILTKMAGDMSFHEIFWSMYYYRFNLKQYAFDLTIKIEVTNGVLEWGARMMSEGDISKQGGIIQ